MILLLTHHSKQSHLLLIFNTVLSVEGGQLQDFINRYDGSDIDALDVLPLQTRMRMLEDCLDAGLKYSSELAELIDRAVPEADEDEEGEADTEAIGKENLNQWIEDAGG